MTLDLAHHSGARGRRPGSPVRHKRTRVWIVVGIFLAFVGVAWAWAFQRAPGRAGSADGVPVLMADSHPTREKPTNPGGMQVPDIDPLSYDSGRDPPKVENILPAPEQPLPTPAATPVSAPTSAAAMPAATAPAAQVVLAAPPPPKPYPPRVATTRSAHPAAPAARPKPKPQPVDVADRVADSPPRAVVLPPAPVSGGSGYLQLGAARSATDALEVGQRLRRRYGNLLRPFAFNYSPVDLGPRGIYYRILAGPMGSSRAAQICQLLKRRGATCLVAGR